MAEGVGCVNIYIIYIAQVIHMAQAAVRIRLLAIDFAGALAVEGVTDRRAR